MTEIKSIDIHTHVNFAAFNEDKLEVVKRALDAGVAMINVGTQQSTSHSAVELAQGYEHGVYAAVGLHPVHTFSTHHDTEELGGLGQEFTSRQEDFDYNFYKQLALDPKVVAIGECGLDYFHLDGDPSPLITRQKEIFEAQVCLAEEIGKPLMLHVRDPRPMKSQLLPEPSLTSAYADVLMILNSHPRVIGDVHFFAGGWEVARQFLDRGFSLSFTGVITFTHDYDELIKQIPLDRLMVETDAPYVSPAPHRGQRNEPLYVLEVLKRLAEIKAISPEEAAQQTLANARQLFGLTGL